MLFNLENMKTHEYNIVSMELKHLDNGTVFFHRFCQVMKIIDINIILLSVNHWFGMFLYIQELV